MICAGKEVDSSTEFRGCKFSAEKLPVTEGKLNGVTVSVMRDTGCTGVVVKRSLVNSDQLLGRTATCMLVDKRRVSKVPVARIQLDTPFFKGETDALCMNETMYDVTIGNIDGSQLPVLDDFNGATSLAVETRSQVLHRDEPYRKLRVPEAVAHVTRSEFRDQQSSDGTLAALHAHAKNGTVKNSKNGNRTSFLYRKDLLYRKFEAQRSNKQYYQLVVPENLRQTVLKVAHESIMSGHLGVRKDF